MAINIKPLKRHFDYNGTILPDLNPDAKPQEIIELYSATYAELVSGFVESENIVNGINVITIKTAVGTKG